MPLKGQSVAWFTDNQNVVRIVNRGSKVPALQEIAMDIYRTCLLNGVSIDLQWIPRDLNSAADEISKFIDHDDYTINDMVFNALDGLWVLIPAIGSLARIIPKSSVSTPDFINPVQVV